MRSSSLLILIIPSISHLLTESISFRLVSNHFFLLIQHPDKSVKLWNITSGSDVSPTEQPAIATTATTETENNVFVGLTESEVTSSSEAEATAAAAAASSSSSTTTSPSSSSSASSSSSSPSGVCARNTMECLSYVFAVTYLLFSSSSLMQYHSLPARYILVLIRRLLGISGRLIDTIKLF